MSEIGDAVNRKLAVAGIPSDPEVFEVEGNGRGGEARMLPYLVTNEGNVIVAKNAGSLLALTGEIFRMNGTVFAWFGTRDSQREMLPMTALRFMSWVEQFASLQKWIRDPKNPTEWKMTPTSLSQAQAAMILSSDSFGVVVPELRRINSICLPVRRGNGVVELLPHGYDSQSKVFTELESHVPNEMPVEEAKTILWEMHQNFPWQDRERDFPAHLASMLSLFCAKMLDASSLIPAFIYFANTSGSGKSWLAKIAIATTCGKATATPFSEDEELRKQLFTSAGEPYIFFDDVTRPIGNGYFNSFLTNRRVKSREMNTQRNLEKLVEGVVLVTGNNVSLSKDMRRRSVVIELFNMTPDGAPMDVPHPWDDGKLPALRPQAADALWSLVRNWETKERPAPPKSWKKIDMAPEWYRLIGGILSAAGYSSPFEPSSRSVEISDPDIIAFRDVLALLVSDIGPSGQTQVEGRRLTVMCHDAQISKAADGRWEPGKNDESVFKLSPKGRSAFGKWIQGQVGLPFTVDKNLIQFGLRGETLQKSFTIIKKS